MKTLYLIAGANGSGKTTLARELLEGEDIPFLNADEIAQKLCPRNIKEVQITAGKKMFALLDTYAKNNQSFALETTLSGNLYTKIINKLKENGYRVHLVYVFLDNPELCIERIKIRVKEGGHYIPNGNVIRRYRRSVRNFWQIYRTMVDDWTLYYNGPQKALLIAAGEGDKIDIADEILYNAFMERVKHDK